jgi:NAD-specific glutamate dehydrogenase
MMQKSQSLKVTHTSQLKKDKIESSKVVSSKQSIILKQILELVSQQHQDLYICLKDQKTGKIHQYSSNVPEFGLSKIASIVKSQKKTKTDVTQALDALSEKISDVATQVSQQETSQEQNESTTESKPNKICTKIPVLTETENN